MFPKPFTHKSTHIDNAEESASPDNSDSFSSYAPQGPPSERSERLITSVESNIRDTIPRNVLSKEKLADWVRINVYAVAPDGMRCIVSLVELLATNPTDVELCHAIEAAIKRKLLRTNEFCFGLQPGTLSFNSRYNVFLLRVDLHKWYDHGGIIFVPVEDNILDSIEKLVGHNISCFADPSKRKSFKDVEVLNRKRYKYRLVVLHMEPNSRTISRQQLVNGKDTGTASVHSYPFQDDCFQNIESHLNPCFALAHACHQINKGLAKKKYTLNDLNWRPELKRVLEITEGWEDYEVVPKEFLNAKPPVPRPPTPTPLPSGSARLKKQGSARPLGSATASRAAGKAPPLHLRLSQQQSSTSRSQFPLARHWHCLEIRT
ncbi:hypothetical protein J3R30DRAFT_3553219 [Lentinula aciculospora]|uniref:Uncharacterized protein n=1 Tax=Lentinula aciculospora TaxID=153920 RepID=A0A9W9DGF0_9AGAR|nr:hypothetical protein J3R30DRAFT_3553219 [Lentinula aciculospora]